MSSPKAALKAMSMWKSAVLVCGVCAIMCLPQATSAANGGRTPAFSMPPSLPRLASSRQRLPSTGLCSLRLSASGGSEDKVGGGEDSVVTRVPREGTSLKEIMETPGSMRVSRAKISAEDMAAMQADAAAADPTIADARRRNVALAIVSPLVGAGLFAVNRQQPQDPITLLRKMEAASLPIEVALQNGKPTVIEFFADWCKDCKLMAPQMAELEKQYAGKEVNFLVLDAEKKENEKLVGLLQVDVIPQFTFLGGDAKVQTTLYGSFPPRVMEGQLKALSEGTQLPFCGADKCFLSEEELKNARRGDRNEL